MKTRAVIGIMFFATVNAFAFPDFPKQLAIDSRKISNVDETYECHYFETLGKLVGSKPFTVKSNSINTYPIYVAWAQYRKTEYENHLSCWIPSLNKEIRCYNVDTKNIISLADGLGNVINDSQGSWKQCELE